MDPQSGYFNFDTVLVMRPPYSAADIAAAQPRTPFTEHMINPDTGVNYTQQEVAADDQLFVEGKAGGVPPGQLVLTDGQCDARAGDPSRDLG